ncbi:hypothetical protein [Labilithrix luteola]|uniref:hypothetical protein n=1 Tax=Labilithrix luteola TaxID=1391654 RepID=UPI001969EFB6|nr:hypothetical protein [Labilithrix luteola]
MLRTGALVALLTIALAATGCAGTSADDAESGQDALYRVPSGAKEGEVREVILSNVPALSRDAAERSRGEVDAVVKSWHVHYVTQEGFRGVMMYGADDEGMVRLAFVVDDTAQSLVVVEPDEDDTEEGALSEVAAKPQAALPPAMLAWFSDEFARLGKLAAQASNDSGGVRTQTTLDVGWKCAARATTMILAMASSFVISPAGAVIASAVEAAAWGDFGNAAVIGVVGGTPVAMQASAKAGIRQAGKVLGTLGGVGAVGLLGVGLVLAPKATLDALVPPQCKKEG